MTKGTILILVGPEYEDLEVWYPKLRLEEAGYETPLAGTGESVYRGKHGYPCPVDGHVRDFPADALAGILAPGGWAPDKLRRDRDVLARVREVHEAGKMVATIRSASCRRRTTESTSRSRRSLSGAHPPGASTPARSSAEKSRTCATSVHG